MLKGRKKFKIFSLLVLISSIGIFCVPVSGLHIWNVNDPNSCPLEAEIGESIIIRGDPPPQEYVVKDPYNATDEQKQLCSELRGSDITMGEFLRIVYPHLWNGLSPEDQKMYDSYKKAWGAVDPIPLPPWHEPGEAAPSEIISTLSSNTLANTLLSHAGTSKLSRVNISSFAGTRATTTSNTASTASLVSQDAVSSVDETTASGTFDMASFAASYRSGGTEIASKSFGLDVLAARGIGG
jgi:hypothetical protein